MQLIVGIFGCLEKCVEVIIFSMIFQVIILKQIDMICVPITENVNLNVFDLITGIN